MKGFGMDSITITVPLPAKQLSPNSRCHWARKAEAVKNARQAAHILSLQELALHLTSPPLWAKAMSQLVFFFKANRRHDPDNLLASVKSYFDGIADAGIMADDSGLGHHPVIIQKDKKNPRLEITITKGDPDD